MRIQRVPAGLLDYLKLRSQGETPDALLKDVRPTIDLSPNYDMERHEAVSEPINMVTGQIEFIEVPSDEVWKLVAVAVKRDQAVIAASIFLWSFSVERLLGAGLEGVPFHTSPRIDVPSITSVLTRMEYAYTLPKPFFLRAGQRLTLSMDYGVSPTTGGNIAWVGDFWAHIIRMKV